MANDSNSTAELVNEGIILSASRRHAQVASGSGEVYKGMIASRAMNLTVGDRVRFTLQGDEAFVQEVLPRKNALTRVYRRQSRDICANLDMLFIVSAVRPEFNTSVIDRISVAASLQDIPVTLILNKVDLDNDPIKEVVSRYSDLGFELIWISAKFGNNMDELTNALQNPELRAVALSGISGVGKSTILNKLVPAAETRTGELSLRTGQGKQTTTQSFAYTYPRPPGENLLVIDLPGLHSFGFAGLDPLEVAGAFPEIAARQRACEFDNCLHIKEGSCAVKDGVEDGSIAIFRYQSYVDIINEIEEQREY